MVDALGWRRKFAVIAPSTNTSVQPEFDDMRPRGVTNHFGRIWIPDDPIHDDADFERLMENIRAEVDNAIDRVMTCRPDYLIMGMSSETFWDGAEGSRRLLEAVEQRSGVRVAMGLLCLRGRARGLRRHQAHRGDHTVHARGRRPGGAVLHRLRV